MPLRRCAQGRLADIQQKGKIISVPHDWCKSTDSPVPYKIWAWQSSASNLANTVRQTDCRSHVLGSIVNQCYGDEPGTGGGVKSGTNLAECTPLSASPTVRAENRPMVRYLDKWWMNHKNTWGCLNNSEDMGTYDTPKAQTIDRIMVASADDEEEEGKPKIVDPILGPQPQHVHTGDPTEDEKIEHLLRSEERSLITLTQRFGLRISQGNTLRNAKPKGSALKDDPYHRGASFMKDEAASKGTTFEITGRDGQPYTLTQMPGEMNGTTGRFEYITDAQGNLTHQQFIPGGTINGTPIKP